MNMTRKEFRKIKNVLGDFADRIPFILMFGLVALVFYKGVLDWFSA
jgi:hypothetical protein